MTPRDKGLVSDELGGLLTYRIIIITSRKRTEVCRVTGDLVLSAIFSLFVRRMYSCIICANKTSNH